MNPRLTLALAAAILIAGAVSLWWSDRNGPQPDAPAAPASAERPSSPAPPQQEYVLAISWHPAFCETKPGLTECRTQRASDFAADNFSLHGLWPQDGQYCGVSGRVESTDRANRWSDLPEVALSDQTRRDLERVMPGVAAALERHEWVVHGTCAGTDAETYYRRSVDLLDEVNSSALRSLFADSIGRRITSAQVRARMDDAFGAGSGRKLRIDCEDDGNRELISELRISLDGDVMGSAPLARLIRQGRNVSVGCSGGIVDPVGTQ